MSLIHNDNQLAHEILRAFTTYFENGTNQTDYEYAVTMYPKYQIDVGKYLDALESANLKENISKQAASGVILAHAVFNKVDTANNQRTIQFKANTDMSGFQAGQYVRFNAAAITDSTKAFPIAWDNKIASVDATNKRITLTSNIQNQDLKANGTVYAYTTEDLNAEVWGKTATANAGTNFPKLVETIGSNVKLNNKLDYDYANSGNNLVINLMGGTSGTKALHFSSSPEYDLKIWEVPHRASRLPVEQGTSSNNAMAIIPDYIDLKYHDFNNAQISGDLLKSSGDFHLAIFNKHNADGTERTNTLTNMIFNLKLTGTSHTDSSGRLFALIKYGASNKKDLQLSTLCNRAKSDSSKGKRFYHLQKEINVISEVSAGTEADIWNCLKYDPLATELRLTSNATLSWANADDADYANWIKVPQLNSSNVSTTIDRKFNVQDKTVSFTAASNYELSGALVSEVVAHATNNSNGTLVNLAADTDMNKILTGMRLLVKEGTQITSGTTISSKDDANRTVTLSASLNAQIDAGTKMYMLGGIEDLIINRWNKNNALFTGNTESDRVITGITTTIDSAADQLSRYLLKKTPHSDTDNRATVTSGYVKTYTLTLKDGAGVNAVNTNGNSNNGQATITLDSVDDIKVGQTVTGHANLPSLVKVKSIDTANKTVTLTADIKTSPIPNDTSLKFMGNIWWDYKKDVTNGDLTNFKSGLKQFGTNNGVVNKNGNTNFRVYFFPTSEATLNGDVTGNGTLKQVVVNASGSYANVKKGDKVLGTTYGTDNTVDSVSSDGLTITLTKALPNGLIANGSAIEFFNTDTLTVSDITSDVSNVVSHLYYSERIHNPQQLKNVIDLSKDSNFTFALAANPSTETNTSTDHVAGVTTVLEFGSNMGDSSKGPDTDVDNANYSFVSYDWFRTGAANTSNTVQEWEDHSSSEGITHINRNGKEFVAYVTNQYQFDQVAGLTKTNYYQRSVAAPTLTHNERGQTTLQMSATDFADIMIGHHVTGHRNIPDGNWVTAIDAVNKRVTLKNNIEHPESTVNGAVASGVNTITLKDVTGIANGMSVDAIGDYRKANQVIRIPSGTTVTGISGNTITISNATTASIADGSKIRIGSKMANNTQLFFRNSDGSQIDNGTGSNHTGLVTHLKVKKNSAGANAGGASSGAYKLEYSEITSGTLADWLSNNLNITLDLGNSTIETNVATAKELEGAIDASGINDVSVGSVNSDTYWKAILDALKSGGTDTSGKISSITITGNINIPYTGDGSNHPDYTQESSGVSVTKDRAGNTIAAKTYYGVSAKLVNRAKNDNYKPTVTVNDNFYIQVTSISTAAQAALVKKDTDVNRITAATNVSGTTYFQDLLEFVKRSANTAAQPSGTRDFGTGITLSENVGSEASPWAYDTQANNKNLIATTTTDKVVNGNVASGKIITLDDVTDLVVGMSVGGTNIASGTNVTAINTVANQVTISADVEGAVQNDATLNFGETTESLLKAVTLSGKNIYVSTTSDALASRAAADDGVTKIVASAVNSDAYITTLVKSTKSQKITLSGNVSFDYANINSTKNAFGPNRDNFGSNNPILVADKLVRSGNTVTATVNTAALANYAKADSFVDTLTATAVNSRAYLLHLLDAGMDRDRTVNATLSGDITDVNYETHFTGTPIYTGGAVKTTADLAAGGTVVNLVSVRNLKAGASATGTNIPANTTIASVDTTNVRVTLSAAVTGTGLTDGQTITFGQQGTANKVTQRHTSSTKNKMSDYVTFTLGSNELRAEVNNKSDFDLAKADNGINGLRALSIADKDYFAAVVTQASTASGDDKFVKARTGGANPCVQTTGIGSATGSAIDYDSLKVGTTNYTLVNFFSGARDGNNTYFAKTAANNGKLHVNVATAAGAAKLKTDANATHAYATAVNSSVFLLDLLDFDLSDQSTYNTAAPGAGENAANQNKLKLTATTDINVGDRVHTFYVDGNGNNPIGSGVTVTGKTGSTVTLSSNLTITIPNGNKIYFNAQSVESTTISDNITVAMSEVQNVPNWDDNLDTIGGRLGTVDKTTGKLLTVTLNKLNQFQGSGNYGANSDSAVDVIQAEIAAGTSAADSKTLFNAFLDKPTKLKKATSDVKISVNVGDATNRVDYSKVESNNNIREHFSTDGTEGNTRMSGNTNSIFCTVATEAQAKEMKTDVFIKDVTATAVNSNNYFNHMIDAASGEADTSGTGSHTQEIKVTSVTLTDNITTVDYTQKVAAASAGALTKDRLIGSGKIFESLINNGKSVTVQVSNSTDYTNAINENLIDKVDVTIGSADTKSTQTSLDNAARITFLHNLLDTNGLATTDSSGTAIKTKLSKLTITADIDGFDHAKVDQGDTLAKHFEAGVGSAIDLTTNGATLTANCSMLKAKNEFTNALTDSHIDYIRIDEGTTADHEDITGSFSINGSSKNLFRVDMGDDHMEFKVEDKDDTSVRTDEETKISVTLNAQKFLVDNDNYFSITVEDTFGDAVTQSTNSGKLSEGNTTKSGQAGTPDYVATKTDTINASYGRNTLKLNYTYKNGGTSTTIRFDETATDYTIENESKIASCFLAGTMINTPSGLRAIETLRQGDKVNTSTGTATVDRLILSTVLPVEESQVYTIPKNAFGQKPSAPVSASKRHMINGNGKWKMMRTWAAKRKAVKQNLDENEKVNFYNLRLNGGTDFMVSGIAAKSL